MSLVAVRIDPAGITRMSARLATLEAKIPQAIALGLNEGGDKVRTQVQQALWKQTGTRTYGSITSRVRTARAFEGGLTYQIIATGKGMPILEFPVRLTRKGVDAKVWGVDHLFQRSFGISGAGQGGFRARTTSKRFPIRKLYGPSVAKELSTGAVPTAFSLSAAAFIPMAIEKRLARVFG